MVTLPALVGNTFVIKAHAGPTWASRLLQRLGLLRITYIYRDPRDAMLSAYDYGQRALQKGRPNAFSYLTDFQKSLDFIMDYVRIWEKWMKEGIADALMVYAPMSDAVGQVQNLIKSKLTRVPVFLIRETDNKKFEQEYRKEFSAVRGGRLDGIVVDEMKDYHPHPQYWCKLLE